MFVVGVHKNNYSNRVEFPCNSIIIPGLLILFNKPTKVIICNSQRALHKAATPFD